MNTVKESLTLLICSCSKQESSSEISPKKFKIEGFELETIQI